MPKRTFLSVVTLLALVTCTARADEWRKTIALTGKSDILVDSNDAEIRVNSQDRNGIEVRVVTVGYKIGPDEVRVDERQSGNHLELNVHVPSRHFGFDFHSRSVRVELTVPQQSDLNLHSGDGSIRVLGVKGSLRLDSGDGELEVREGEGRLKANTRDGNIRVQGLFSALDLETGDGNIDAEALAGSKMTSSWVLRTGDGSVRLGLPDNFPAELDAHTGDGRVEVDFPLTINGSVDESTIRGKINGGGPLLQIRSGDGNINLRRG
jgi:DUF4097 and DUF4098 domain-containing protein YvlB